MVKRFFVNMGIFWTIFALFRIQDIMIHGVIVGSISVWFLNVFLLAIVVSLIMVFLEKYLK